MADTTPLPPAQKKSNRGKAPLSDVETNNLKQHYQIHANGLYGNYQYADLSLLLRKGIFK